MTDTLLLGKKPARDGAFPHRFAAIFSAPDLPKPPTVFGRPDLVSDWGMLANSSVGDCVIASACHQTMIARAFARATLPKFSDDTAIADYSAATGYVPGDESTDRGTEMGEFAKYWRDHGIAEIDGVRHKIDLSARLGAGNVSQVALAAYLFDAADIGVQLPSSAMDQFRAGKRWEPVSGASIEGGHCVPAIGRNSNGDFLVVTWGRIHPVAPSFLATYMDEGVVHLSIDLFDAKNITPRGYDRPALLTAAHSIPMAA